jgi:transcription termination factor Rho
MADKAPKPKADSEGSAGPQSGVSRTRSEDARVRDEGSNQGREGGGGRRRRSRGGQRGGGQGNQSNSGGGQGGGSREGGGGNRDGGGGHRDGGGGQKRGRNRRRRNNRSGGGRGKDTIDLSTINEEELVSRTGLLELMPEGFGFLRFADSYYLPADGDVHVPQSIVRQYEIRPGSMVEGDVAPPQKRNQKPTLVRVKSINGKDPELHADETLFKNLLAIDPDERFVLETPEDEDVSMRVIDLLSPIGKGQRALIVAPPRTGKTVIMQKMANAIATNHPETEIIVLLIDERPEEVTDMKRNTKAEVIASCLDEGTANHVKVTENALIKMRRMVEAGKDVVCLLDSITRLGRAYNNETKHSGRILSGGVDAKTLAKPKAFFGAARNVDEGGSLTIIATALIDTGSRMDQVIFEEFKGTGNMELVLSRQLANNRIFPAVDIAASGTRKEEKLLSAGELEKVNVLRRVLNQLNPNEAMRLLIDRLKKTESNADFLAKFDLG